MRCRLPGPGCSVAGLHPAAVRDGAAAAGWRGPHDRRAVHRRQGAPRRVHRSSGPRIWTQRSAGAGNSRRRDHASDRSAAVPALARQESCVDAVPMRLRPRRDRACVPSRVRPRRSRPRARPSATSTLAEEAVQDAFAAALQRWPSTGLPPSPAGWIITTARNRGDRSVAQGSVPRGPTRTGGPAGGARCGRPAARRSAVRRRKSCTTSALRLIFTCCHPALATSAQRRR